MTKKVKGTAQLDNLIIKEKDPNGVKRDVTIRDQSKIEWEVGKFYWNLYKIKESAHSADEVRRELGNNHSD